MLTEREQGNLINFAKQETTRVFFLYFISFIKIFKLLFKYENPKRKKAQWVIPLFSQMYKYQKILSFKFRILK